MHQMQKIDIPLTIYFEYIDLNLNITQHLNYLYLNYDIYTFQTKT